MRRLFVMILLAFLWPSSVVAQVTETKLIAADGESIDNFGNSASIGGRYAIVGAFFNSSLGTLAGAAYVYQRDPKGWTQDAKLLASDGTFGDEFGHSVSIASGAFGWRVIVGASHDNNDNGDDAGSAYVFDRTDTGWVEQAKIIPDDGTAADWFGTSASLSDYAIVGAPLDDSQGEDAGSAYIFGQSVGDIKEWTQRAKLTASDAAAHDWFGISVCIDGDYAIVGAAQEGIGPGKAYIFKRDTTTWREQEILTASDGVSGHHFGESVAIDGDYAIVGAYGDGDNGVTSGAAYVFKRDGENWTQQDKLTASDGQANDIFGYSVSIQGDDAIVGAPMFWPGRHGAAYIFKRDGSEWIEQEKLSASDGGADDQFGWSVSLAEGEALVGANQDDIGSDVDQGSAYVFGGFLPVGIDGDEQVDAVPELFALEQNYPNPFNSATMIRYRLLAPGEVELAVYNLLGQKVRTLVQEDQSSGDYQMNWNGRDGFARPLPSGVYFCRLAASGGVQVRKMVLLR